MSDPLLTVYCDDEDIAVRAGGDFFLLAPKWQKLSYGNDGAFANGAPWILTSATAAFTTAGIATGHVVLLSAPKATYKGSGELLGIATVAPTALTLRRIGASPVGQPPAPAAGLTSVEYTILTLAPQIEAASFWINQTYNITPDFRSRKPSDAYDLRDIRDCCVLTVIVRRLLAEVQDRPNAAWNLKLENYRNELSIVSSRVQLRWTTPGNVPQPTTQFSTRLSR